MPFMADARARVARMAILGEHAPAALRQAMADGRAIEARLRTTADDRFSARDFVERAPYASEESRAASSRPLVAATIAIATLVAIAWGVGRLRSRSRST